MKIRKLLYLIMAMAILLMVACSNKSSAPPDVKVDKEELNNLNESGMPIVKEPITLKFMAGKSALSADNYDEVLLWKEYSKMTGINIKWELIPTDGLEEKRNLALASGSLPDVFYTMGMPNSDLLKYGEQGIFIILNDLIEDYMPNLTKLLEEYPDIKKGLVFPDGNIYAVPTIYDPEFTSVLTGAKPWIRKDWLEQLDIDMPETTEEFYQYLKAVKETDLNGNGKADEIPFGADGISGLGWYLKGAFDIGNKGVKHAFLDEDPKTDELRFYPIADGYKNMLEYMNKLYKEGLIQENIYTIETNQSYGMGAEGLYGSAVITSASTIYGKEGEKFVGMPALEGPNGDRKYNRVTSPLAHMGGFVVTNNNKNIAATLRWMDYFYSDEGAKLFFMGIENETFEVDENGDLDYVDKIKNSPDGLTLEQELSKYITWLGGGYPGIVKEATFKGAESLPSSLEATAKIEEYMTDEVWPSFTFTNEEDSKLAGVSADIEKYVNEMQDKFITGKAPFSEWDKYVKTIKSMGLDEYMDIQKAAYERYKSN